MNNLEYIDKHPEEYAKTLTEEELLALILALNAKYNNDGESGISDNSFDALVHSYKKMSKKSYDIIGSEPRDKIRAELPFFAPSLNKVKVGADLTNFINTDDQLIVMDKLDGVSGIIEYQDGIPINVFLRGNGKTGGDISYVLDHMDIPQLKNYGEMVVRGEFVMEKKTWREKYSLDPRIGNFSTSRNFVCGKLNAGKPSTVLDDIKFVAFDIMHIEGDHLPSPSECLEILEDEGFEIVYNREAVALLTTDVVGFLDDRRDTSPYPVDGVVLAIDEPREVPNQLENPSHTVAFKAVLSDQVRTTEVVSVDWRISRHGRLVPVVEYKPVFIEGRRLTKATGHNARRCVNEWKIGIGSKIQVTASGGIIPKILDVLETSEKPLLPVNDPAWKWQGCDIVLVDIENNKEVQKKRLVHFFKQLNIPGIREGMITRMFDGGLNTLQLILKASETRMQQIKGIGAKKSAAYRKSITEKIPHSKLYRLMYASHCFEKGLGKTFMRQIAVNIPTFLVEPDNVLETRLKQLKGIGVKRCAAFIGGIQKFRVFILDFPNVAENNRVYFDELAKKGFNHNIVGKKFVFTTLDNDNLEDYILDHKGSLEKAVTKDTTAVITGNPLELTPKTREARSLGVKIYTVKEFESVFGFTL